jgi:quercetin dioxygenase-like cupin family protein
MTRILNAAQSARPNPQAVERTVVSQSEQSALVVWQLLPGQEIPAHRHPAGQDTWVVLEGEADYVLGRGETRRIKAGDVAIAPLGEIHGARNTGSVPFLFVSVVAPADAGYELLEDA